MQKASRGAAPQSYDDEPLHDIGADSVFFIRCADHSEAAGTHDFIQI